MPTLKQGSSGPDVRNLQQKFKELGFDPNGVDGHFGTGTAKAVRAFQQANGLKVDGEVGPKMRTALQLDGVVSAAAAPGGTSATTATPAETPGLNLAALTGLIPDEVRAQIPQTAADFGITTNLRLAHLLAQCALESTNFTAKVENLFYKTTERILKVFGKHFHGIDPAPFVRNPEKLGNHVYANRNGNGDDASGDGFKFRGRGFIQLTGKDNYTAFSKFVGEDCVANPDLVATKFPLSSAAFFFTANNIFAICDQGANDATVRKVSARVNGRDPAHGLADRLRNFKKFHQALSR
jgi:putative chitinase